MSELCDLERENGEKGEKEKEGHSKQPFHVDGNLQGKRRWTSPEWKAQPQEASSHLLRDSELLLVLT